MSYYVNNDLLSHFEGELRKFHIKLIKGICHNVFNKPELAITMLSKYIKQHENSNLNKTIRPPRIKEIDCNCDDESTCTCFKSIDNDTNNTNDENDDNDTYDKNDDNQIKSNQCSYMVHYNRKLRQCKHKVVGVSDYCGIHSNQIVFPFGAKEKNTNEIIQPNRYIDDSDDDSDDSDDDSDGLSS